MQKVSLISADCSLGIKDYTSLIREVCDYDYELTLPKLMVYDQKGGREIMETLLNFDYDLIHVQYNNDMFMTDFSHYEHLENLLWFIDYNQSRNKQVVFTIHGVPHYSTPKDTNWAGRLTWKLIRKSYHQHVLPVLNTCEIIVHTHHDKKQLEQLGIEHASVVTPPSRPTLEIIKRSNRRTRIVVPGQYSGYKNYELVINMLSELPEDTHLYISDTNVKDGLYNNIVATGMLDRVHLITFHSDKEEYIQQLKTYDIAVLPYTENVASSGSLQDCLQAALPCVTTKTRNFIEFENMYGCIITTSTPNHLTVTVNRCLHDTDYVNGILDNILTYQQDTTKSLVSTRMDNVFKGRLTINPLDIKTGPVVNVFMCCRNNQATLADTLAGLVSSSDLLNNPVVRYYIMENDSDDGTPEMIRDFYKTHDGEYACVKTGKRQWSSSPGVGRMRDMAYYRNRMKGLCTDWSDSQYSFIVDTEVQFTADIMREQIAYLDKNIDVAMVTPYGRVGTSDVYYDQFAYRDMNSTQDISNVKDRVRSAFAGFVCIRTPVLERCEWSCVDGDTSEHVPFCDMVRRHGDIAIDTSTIVRW